MKLELCQIARARSKTRSKARARRTRQKDAAGGLGYLFARIRRELAERWALAHPDPSGPGRVLLLDFDDTPLHLGEAVTVRQVSPLASQSTAPPAVEANFFKHDSSTDPDGFDGVVIGLQMAWLEPEAVLTEALRVLRPGGSLLFCTFGPDTLQQLRWAWGEVDEFPHVHPFIDMHLIGDQLLRCGFARPIVDVDRVTVEYERADLLYADLRGEGFTNILQARRKTLTGKARFDGFGKALDSLRESGAGAGAPLAITYELIYGVATAPAAPASSASQVRVAPPRTGD